MRSRPEIDLRVPAEAHPGHALQVQVTLTSLSETPIDFVDVTVRFVEQLRFPAGTNGIRNVRCELRQRVAEAGKLAEGAHPYEASFKLPEDAPLTYAGGLADYEAQVIVDVSIPWWPDAQETKILLITPAPRPRPADAPLTSSTLRGAAPFLELSLPGSHVAPGEALVGALAFANLGGARATTIDVTLLGVERAIVYGRAFSAEEPLFSAFKAVEGAQEGREVSFRLDMKRDVVPSFATPGFKLEHLVEVRLGYEGGAVTERVPVVVGPYGARAPAEKGKRRKRVGSSRWRAIWARAGKAVGLSLDEDALELYGELAGCEVEVVRGEGTGGKLGLKATLRFPAPWGLDLRVRRRRLMERGVKTGDRAFDDRYAPHGRDPEQVRAALVPALREAMLAFGELALDDAGARVWSPGAGYDEAGLGILLRQVVALAEAAGAAAAAIPPPWGMEAALPAWRRFAGDVEGALAVGCMRLSGGAIDGAPLEIETRFERMHPAGATISVGVEPPLEQPFDAGNAEAVAAAPPAVRELCAAIARHGAALARDGVAREPEEASPASDAPPLPGPTALRVVPGRVSLEIGAALSDPAAAREVVGSMLALAAALRGDRRGGPYR